ncbi:MAG TPA: ribonuclease J, partial [Polyangiaceae bacterium]|nr:ribonuclease J [Polyangiaceae bacterium]
ERLYLPIVPDRSTDPVSMVPLGGLGEVGMNCFALVCQGQALLVDCGVNFPEDDLGIDVIHPDFSWIAQSGVTLLGTFVTHGHEDHIGALPFLLSQFPSPVWGPAHALALAEHRLKEREVRRAVLHRVKPGESYTIGPFNVEPVRVSHSITEASALCIRTPAGTIVHSGDFKFDAEPSDGEVTDEARLSAIGDEGVALLLSDSTNIDRAGSSGSEGQVARALEPLIQEAQQRVVVALFSSNVQRLISIGQIAERCGRKICLLGRSLQLHVEVALATKRLVWPRGILIPAEQAAQFAPEKLLVLASGTQAEMGSALQRLASGEHQQLKLARGDTAILSSRTIPGNDRKVVRMIGDLLRQGVRVHSTFSNREIHASGHAAREEQRHMLELIRPRAFVPVHGTLHHLTRHAELAREVGVAQIEVVENGQVVTLTADGISLGKRVSVGRVSVGFGGSVLPKAVLTERLELARQGSVVFSVAFAGNGQQLGPAELSVRGVPGFENAVSVQTFATRIADGLPDQIKKWRKQRVDVRIELTRLVRRLVEQRTGVRPLVEVHLIESND